MKLARKGKSNKIRRWLRGGPWGDNYVLVPPETMVFTALGFTGRYVYGRWEDVR